LGYGYQEKYYERAIAKCFKEKNIVFKNQVMYRVKFKGEEIGKYYLDFLVDNKIVLELKKGNHFSKRNIEQVKGYLKVTKKKLAILANFTANDVKFLRILNIN
jgi:GxxExxY protein